MSRSYIHCRLIERQERAAAERSLAMGEQSTERTEGEEHPVSGRNPLIIVVTARFRPLRVMNAELEATSGRRPLYRLYTPLSGWWLGVMVSVVGHINEVAVRRTRLVLGWVTVFGGHTTLVSLPSHLGQLSLLPLVGQENEYRPTAVTFCEWRDSNRLRKRCGLPSITLGASPLPAQDHGSGDEHRTLASHSLCVQLC